MQPAQAFFLDRQPSSYVLPYSKLNASFNQSVPYGFIKNTFQMPPPFMTAGLPIFSNPLSLLQFQNYLLAQSSALNKAVKMPAENKIFNSCCDTLEQNILSTSPPLRNPFETESPLEKLEIRPKYEVSASLGLPDDPEICFEAQIKQMIQFFVNSFGTASNSQINQVKQKYSLNPQLHQAFEALESKFTTTTRTREEIVKWVLRRCLKVTKASIKKETKKDQKQVLKDLCTKYFDSNEYEEEDEVADRVLPFRKNSKNKTMNTNFVEEIFQSKEFRSDYKEFLKNIDDIIKKENTDKINKLTKFIVECAKKQDFSSISKYKRIPWLKVWFENTKRVAEELDNGNYDGKAAKKTKKN